MSIAREPEIDVVILSWNDGPLLDAAVESALASEGVTVTVWVVDNGSAPPVTAFADPRVVVVRNDENRGVAPARAQGVELGCAPLVCLLDSDARLHADCLARLAAEAGTPGTALAAPVFVDQLPEASAGRAPTLVRKVARGLNLTDRYASVRRGPDSTSWDIDFAIGACQLVRRDAYEAVGGLDVSIFYGPEDVDFCLRLRRSGRRVVQVGVAACVHPPRRRNRGLLTRRGLAHAHAVARHLWRHRGRRGAHGTPATSGGAR